MKERKNGCKARREERRPSSTHPDMAAAHNASYYLDCPVWAGYAALEGDAASAATGGHWELVWPWMMLALCVPLCLCGYYAMRVTLSLAAFVVGGLWTLRVVAASGSAALACEHLTMVVVLSGGSCALFAGTLMHTLAYGIGAASVCGVAATLFSACGATCAQPLWQGAPVWLGLPLAQFWGSMAVSAVVGVALARSRYKELIALVAATVGSYGIALVVRTMWARGRGEVVGDAAFSAVMLGVIAGGLGVQYAVYHTRCSPAAKARRERRRCDAKSATACHVDRAPPPSV